jgi:hypothetical protein
MRERGHLFIPIFIVLAALWFIKRDLWPWYTKRMAEKDIEENRRHDQFLQTPRDTNRLTEQFTTAINAINSTINGLGQIISNQTDKMDDYHREVMDELRRNNK